MERNVGEFDRRMRLLAGTVALFAGILGYLGYIRLANILPQALTSLVFVLVGLVLVVTGLRRKCLFYRLAGFKTD